MSDSQPTSTRLRTFLRMLVVFIITFDAAFLWQRFSGVHASEFGAHPDEAAHYVTGLFVRDAMVKAAAYVGGGFQGSPVQVGREFANEFYAHYPKVALGVWPPGFYVVQSAWTLPFGESRLSVLLLMAALAGITATVLFESLYRTCGIWPAAVASLLWLLGPLVREYYGMVMAETLSALLMFAATLLWGRYLERNSIRTALGFALLMSAAIMTKGTGVALVLMCGFSLLFRRAWAVLARPSLWGAVVVVAVCAGIWTWTFRNEGVRVGGWEGGEIGWQFTRSAAPFYARAIGESLGYAVAIFGLLGMALAGIRQPVACAMSSLVLAVWVFQAIVPVGLEARHILPAAPALAYLAVHGALGAARSRKAEQLTLPQRRRRESLWCLLPVLLVFPQSYGSYQPKVYHGFAPLAEELVRTAPAGAKILVSSDASGEGMFISELAMRDARPNFRVERGSKSLVKPEGRNWAGRNLRERFPDDEALLAYLVKSDVQFVVLDAAVPEEKRAGYHDQIQRVIRENTGLFWPVAESPVTRNNLDLAPPIRLYRIVRDEIPR
jgi:hypothetical protein